MIALGELDDVPDAFDNHPWKYQLYALFFMITLITQLVYLNMVIAFMAYTFDKMLEIKSILALQHQMKIISLSRMIFGKNENQSDEENHFLYIVEAQNDDQDEDSAAYKIDSD